MPLLAYHKCACIKQHGKPVARCNHIAMQRINYRMRIHCQICYMRTFNSFQAMSTATNNNNWSTRRCLLPLAAHMLPADKCSVANGACNSIRQHRQPPDNVADSVVIATTMKYCCGNYTTICICKI